MTVVRAKTKYVKISATKARDLAKAITGLPVGHALGLLQANRRRGAALICKALKSAIANAENNDNLSADRLVVSSAVVEEGPRMRRYWPRSRGMVSPILRRFSHISIELVEAF